MSSVNDGTFSPVASVTLAASQPCAWASRPCTGQQISTYTHKATTTGRAELPKNNSRIPKSRNGQWFLSERGMARRWLTGIGIGAGGLTFFGPSGPQSSALAGIFRWLRPAAAAAGDQKRILILMSMTGGGHKASADALEAGFKQMYGDKFRIDIVDAWTEHTPAPFNRMPDTYSFLVKNPILWRMAYTSTQPRICHKPYLWACGNFCVKGMNDLYHQYQPDLVISVHPLMQHIPIRALQHRIRQGLMPPINFTTVVTDFTTCSNMWFHTSVKRCFVPTEDCHRRAARMGLSENQITEYGLPIRPAFAKNVASKADLRKRLRMDPDLPAVLLVGGGEGMGQLEQTVRAIGRKGTRCQVVVVCGRNASLQKRLMTTDFGTSVKLQAEGFVSNMHEYMFASDTIITKAGPGTIAEALICGLPILLNGNVPCQEEGNIPYVLDNNCGTFERDPSKIADILHTWFEETGRPTLASMAANCKKMGQPDALFRMVKDLADLAVHPGVESDQFLRTCTA